MSKQSRTIGNIASLAALIVIGSAFLYSNANATTAPADNATPATWANEQTVQAPIGLPRSTVRIERDTARALGLLTPFPGSDTVPEVIFTSTASRAEVQAHARDNWAFGK